MFKTSFILLSLFVSNYLLAEQTGFERLKEGNERYIKDTLEHPNRTPERRLAVASQQDPFAIIVACSDSRVPPELVFDQGLGDLFVVRVAGNVIGPIELDSVEYAALYLGATVVLVLGHENCGAVTEVVQGNTTDIESVAELIEPAVQEARKKNPSNLIEASVKANALRMKNYLLKTSVIQKLIKTKKIEVYAGFYNLKTGAVEILKG